MSDQQKKTFTLIGLSTLVLVIVGISLLTVFKLRQIGTQPVAPTAPTSKPAAAEGVPAACRLSFTVAPLECNEGPCTEDSQCGEGMICDEDSGTCRNPDNPTSETCSPPEYACNTACTGTTDTGCAQVNPDYSCQEVATDEFRCRLTDNPDSDSCSPQYACDSVCTTDAQCESANSDYSCQDTSEGQRCRLTDNPDSSTCQPESGPVTYACNSGCTDNSQCQSVNTNYTCANTPDGQRCRLTSNTSSSTCQSAPGGTPTPTPSPTPPTSASPSGTPVLPTAGFTLPTFGILGAGGGLLILGALGLLLL